MVMKSCELLLAIVLTMVSAAAAAAERDDNISRRLGNGEIVLLNADSSQSGGSARVQALVQTSAQSVWNVITSCERSFVFVDGLKECQVIEDDGGRAVVHQVVNKGWLYPTQDFIFESLREPYRDIRFNLVEGNLKAMEGTWQFTELPEGVLIDYSIRVRPGLPVPGFIVSWVMRKGMPDLIACIRGLAGGSGSTERKTIDLERCRGQAEPAG
jgi:ribosome-associated toxin RatA of RatAB toxin-antitoxin module